MSLATQARQLGYHVTLAAPSADLVVVPDTDTLVDGFALGETHFDPAFVVVSTQARATKPRCARGNDRRGISRLCRQPAQDDRAARQAIGRRRRA